MNHLRLAFVAGGLVFATALLAVGCKPPTPVTPCSDTAECPTNFHCDIEHSFCVPDRADASVSTGDGSPADAASGDGAVTDRASGDRAGGDRAGVDRAGADGAGVDGARSDATRPDGASADHADAGARDAMGDAPTADGASADGTQRDVELVDHGHHDAATADWWDPAWRVRTRLTVDNTGGAEDLIDFPVLVELNAAHFDFAAARSDLADVRFVATDGSALAADLDTRDATPRVLYWVSLPLVAAGTTTTIWVYYGNPLAGAGSRFASEVWSHYAGVWHLASDGRDSSPHGGVLFASSTFAAPGVIGSGQDLPGNGECLGTVGAAPSAITQAVDVTMSLWAKVRSLDAVTWDDNPLITCTTDLFLYNYSLNIDGANVLHSYWNSPAGIRVDATSAIASVTDDWHHYAMTRTVTNNRALVGFYLDGRPVGDPVSDSHPPEQYSQARFWIGSDPYDPAGNRLDGVVDEARVEPLARSAAWIDAIHRSETLQMVSFGAIEGY